jgi:hypothetical protein
VKALKPLLKGLEHTELIATRPGPELKKMAKAFIDW